MRCYMIPKIQLLLLSGYLLLMLTPAKCWGAPGAAASALLLALGPAFFRFTGEALTAAADFVVAPRSK